MSSKFQNAYENENFYLNKTKSIKVQLNFISPPRTSLICTYLVLRIYYKEQFKNFPGFEATLFVDIS